MIWGGALGGCGSDLADHDFVDYLAGVRGDTEKATGSVCPFEIAAESVVCVFEPSI